jgi:chromosome segregation ATPase
MKAVAKAAPRAMAPARKAPAAKTSATADKAAEKQLLRRRRAELQQHLREAAAEYEAAENERLAAESELDANEHHVADMRTAIERLTAELEQARRELRTAQGRTRKLENALTIAARTAANARRHLDAQQQRLQAFNE